LSDWYARGCAFFDFWGI
ncbi:tRNA sulfurtransferase, partial [Haemophilus influenzae]